MKKVALALTAMLAVVGLSSGCAVLPGSSPSASVSAPADSSPSSDYGKQAACSLGSAGISLIRAGGAGSKALAQIIADNTQDQKVKDMANAVVNSTAGEDVRNQLADWLASYCGS
ncbi:MAG: hypothetical protein FWF36_09610 [Propionibacteriaceae bacterium]|nr:hypothetical protein [Propionibacteriaceae bacterium]